MAAVIINGDVSGSVTLQAPSVAGTTVITLPSTSGTLASISSVTNNGVVYINSSGQPTSGSGFVFDGANVGIGTNSPSARLEVKGAGASITDTGIRINNPNASAYSTSILDFYANGQSRSQILGQQNGSSNGGFLIFNTGDSSNALQERMRIDSSGNVGIGTSSPATTLQARKDSAGGTTYAIYTDNGAGGAGTNLAGIGFANSGAMKSSITAAVYGNDYMAFNVGGSGTTERMRIDSSGNVGIGTSSPSAPLTVKSRASDNIGLRILQSSGSLASIQFTDDPVTTGWATIDATSTTFRLVGASVTSFLTGGSERARIDSSGNLLVGTTNAYGKFYVNGQSGNICARFEANATGSVNLIQCVNTATSGTNTLVAFIQNGSQVGSIQTSNTATSYVTSSDYRLKENVQPMSGALARVAALKPCTYNWKIDGSDGEGFIAHELAEVCPHAVTGEKDAVDDDGNPVYQGIDTSFLVATLTAAIQELKADLDATKAELAALKGNA